ncbi:FAD-binding oxidoreductase [Saccharopolyspora halophila]|uniref:FAD-binding oxidoreductase n=1 Tax=Saccharopolyspora halophila TaxID=405551 RepID=A0ABN3G5D3_9PSEU
MKVAVVGLGVLGASAARALTLAGAEVTVFEREAPLAGTSGTSFAWVNSHSKNPRAYHDLNVAGMAEHAALAEDPGPNRPWLAQTGNLEWAADGTGIERLSAAVAELRARDYPVEWISPRRARELAPDLRVPDTDIAFFPTEGHLNPALLMARLWGEARANGARLRRAEVTAIGESGGKASLELADGIHEADAVVMAAGRWTEALSTTTGHRVPVADPEAPGSATVGLLGYTAPVPTRLNLVLTTPVLNVRPEGGGRLVVQGLDLDADADPADPPSVGGEHAAELCRRLGDLLAGAADARLESLRVGQRSVPADGLTVAGFLDQGSRIYALCTHSGITLAPLLGRLAAQEVVTGSPAEQLHGFRPQRLVGAGDLPPLRPARFAGQQ